MAATRMDIQNWFESGVKDGKTHMVVVCDTFDHDDYPVFVMSANEARERVLNPGDMQRVMEVYNLSLPMQEQINTHRAFNY